jgi:hypothetical protein
MQGEIGNEGCKQYTKGEAMADESGSNKRFFWEVVKEMGAMITGGGSSSSSEGPTLTNVWVPRSDNSRDSGPGYPSTFICGHCGTPIRSGFFTCGACGRKMFP